jgi:hypothetical protein
LISTYQPDILPKFFGGSLDVSLFLEKWPMNVEYPITCYMIFSIGHHLERICEHLTHSKKYQSYWTMMLHHFLTVNLILICVSHRLYIFGVPTIFVHDMTDVFLNLLKIIREVQPLKFLTIPSYLLLFFGWVITRNYIFTFEIFVPMWYYSGTKVLKLGHYAMFFKAVELTILAILNWYWLYTIGYAGFKKFTAGIDQDYNLGEVDNPKKKKNENKKNK